MGFRTVVVLANDMAEQWMNDPELGRKIMHSANDHRGNQIAGYGHVAECVHADVQTVLFADSYSAKPMAATHWHQGQTDEARDLKMLKALADKMGYNIAKKRSR